MAKAIVLTARWLCCRCSLLSVSALVAKGKSAIKTPMVIQDILINDFT
jgi:hypothetical protein